ncbi:pyocin knob domain-containing protein [Pseudomonas sessilinigenes]|uniref:Pyocin knob domain-containing protein n=1 Tax=Pseudomonas sessilinigenes TaxID=658629 RepID=A0ABX8MSP4_9PSED|nr:pyocin knob domain-containing protein [Pseudomonas sessilinigenes]AZC22941.1 hypothetical protein C4K39_1246 [Pseudomonas sessilinigenes]QXH41972.1 pyocin knob domain-containing protein [Pseudomonas sessilinigenes]
MARKNIELGVIPSGQGGDTFRSAMVKVNDMTTELYGLTTGQGHEDAVKAILLKYGIGSSILDIGEDLVDWINVTCSALVRNKGLSRLPSASDYYVVTYPLNASYVGQTAINIGSGQFYTRIKAGGWGGWREFLIAGDEAQYIENANGRAIKHKCGALQCWFSSGSAGATTLPIGSLFGSPQYTYTFPVPFVSAPVVTWSTSGAAGSLVWGVHAASNDTITIGNLVSPSGTATAYPQYFATGRWK